MALFRHRNNGTNKEWTQVAEEGGGTEKDLSFLHVGGANGRQGLFQREPANPADFTVHVFIFVAHGNLHTGWDPGQVIDMAIVNLVIAKEGFTNGLQIFKDPKV